MKWNVADKYRHENNRQQNPDKQKDKFYLFVNAMLYEMRNYGASER
jgi:hypothetical protein